MLRFLLDRGIECNHVSQSGKTPLHYAAGFASPNLILLLLSRDANFDALDSFGWSALHFATRYQNLKALQLILNATETARILINIKARDGYTALMLASKDGYTKIVNCLVEAHADRAIKDNSGWTAIHYAVANNRLEALRILSQDWTYWDVRCVGQRNNDGIHFRDMLLTHLAAACGSKQCLEFLMTYSSSFDIEDKAGTMSLLMFAVFSKDRNTVQYLLDRGAKFTASYSGWTPLHWAAYRGDISILDILLKRRHDVRAVNLHGETPMMIAKRHGHHHVLATLTKHQQIALGQGEEDWRQLQNTRQRDLGLAIREGDISWCQDLLTQGALLLPSTSKCRNCDPLIESLNLKSPDTAMFLINKGARLSGITCPEHPCRNYNAIHYCARYNFSSVLNEVINKCRVSYLWRVKFIQCTSPSPTIATNASK